MSVDWTKPIQTRDGREARLIEITPDNVTLVVNSGGIWEVFYCLTDGFQFQDRRETGEDIINVPPAPDSEEAVEAAWEACDIKEATSGVRECFILGYRTGLAAASKATK